MSKTEQSKVLIIKGELSSTGTSPTAPPSFQVLPAGKVGSGEISSAGVSGWEESGAANQELVVPGQKTGSH